MKQKVKQRQTEEENKKDKKMKRHMKGNEASEKGTTVFFRNNITVLKGSQTSSTCPEVRSVGGVILTELVPLSTTDTTRTGPRSNTILGHCCLSCGKALFEV